ncbi:hypothetical protein EZV62_023332 [Acer yangbiense]|uniref:WAT1-related protein n=1 Tax=Acer yangbiense TaxID=1000413 RepID=A0A5C7H1A8_9ROSI|nr:hypothetical protein EZV62_023332 [Acer yangbiense]
MESCSCASYVLMAVVQSAYAVSNVMIKIALERGLNQLVFVVYRHLIALFLLAPLAYALERKQRPSLSFSVTMKIFALPSLGTTVHLNVYYAGLAYTSPTVASALSNVIPALTFLMAFLLGMERVKITSTRGRAKVIGTIICIAGSLVFTFWKGHYLFKSSVERPLINMYVTKETSVSKLNYAKENWIKGSALIFISHIAWSGWLILQGVVLSALVYYLQTWCISKKGLVFAAMFTPLLVVIVGIFSAFAFAERIHLGSFVGAILIVVGLYCVLWGKKMDSPVNEHLEDKKESDNDKIVEISCEK